MKEFMVYKFITCNRCENVIDIENDGYIRYEKEVNGVKVTFYMCIDCLEELMFEDEE